MGAADMLIVGLLATFELLWGRDEADIAVERIAGQVNRAKGQLCRRNHVIHAGSLATSLPEQKPGSGERRVPPSLNIK